MKKAQLISLGVAGVFGVGAIYMLSSMKPKEVQAADPGIDDPLDQGARRAQGYRPRRNRLR